MSKRAGHVERVEGERLPKRVECAQSGGVGEEDRD